MSQPVTKISDALRESWIARAEALHADLIANPDGPWAWLWRVRLDILTYLLQRYGKTAMPGDQSSDLAAPPQASPSEPTEPYADHPTSFASTTSATDVITPLHDAQRRRLQSLAESSAARHAELAAERAAVRAETELGRRVVAGFWEQWRREQAARAAEQKRHQASSQQPSSPKFIHFVNVAEISHLIRNTSYPEQSVTQEPGQTALQREEREVLAHEASALRTVVSRSVGMQPTDAPISDDEIVAILLGL